MKIVLDTNVLISGIFFGGVPGRILEAWRRSEVTLALSPSIFDEYRRVGEELESEYGELGFSAILALIVAHSEIVSVPEGADLIGRDPDDDKFLTCAAAADATMVVSGDDDLLSLESWKGIRIVSPREFVDSHLPEG